MLKRRVQRITTLCLSLLTLYSCVSTLPNYGKPLIFLHLGNAPQVCAERNGLAEITLFANLINLPSQDVTFLFNDKVTVVLRGTNITLTLHKVGLGEHFVVATTADHSARLTWSVWNCGL